VRLDQFNGRDTIGVRSWCSHAIGALKRSRSGITLALRHLSKLADTFANALQKGHELDLPDEAAS
jgi:hypothetical protein